MFFQSLLTDPLFILTYAIALLCAVTIHEAAHAYVALRLGDDTASQSGRLTLNPFAHLDLLGTVFLLLVGFGWGKPVPVNPNNFKKPTKDEALVALAGPFSNLCLAIVVALIFQLTRSYLSEQLSNLLITIGYFNLILMIFNLLPVPPLDGSKIVRLVIGDRAYQTLSAYGIYILIAIVFLPIGRYTIVDYILFPISKIVENFLFK